MSKIYNKGGYWSLSVSTFDLAARDFLFTVYSKYVAIVDRLRATFRYKIAYMSYLSYPLLLDATDDADHFGF